MFAYGYRVRKREEVLSKLCNVYELLCDYITDLESQIVEDAPADETKSKLEARVKFLEQKLKLVSPYSLLFSEFAYSKVTF